MRSFRLSTVFMFLLAVNVGFPYAHGHFTYVHIILLYIIIEAACVRACVSISVDTALEI